MGKIGNKKKTKSPHDRDFSKKGVYCKNLMLKTVFIVIILKITSTKKILSATFGELKYGIYQGYGGLHSIGSGGSQLYKRSFMPRKSALSCF